MSTASSRTIRAAAGSKLRKFSPSARRDSSAICPAISTPVGPAPTIGERQPGLARDGVGLELGDLEGAEDPPAELERVVDRLHARRVTCVLVVAEVRLRRAGCDDQAVVGQFGLLPQRVDREPAVVDVDVDDLGRGRHERCAGVGGRRGSAARCHPRRALRWRPGTAVPGRGGGWCDPQPPPRPAPAAAPWRRTVRRTRTRR